MSDHAIPDTVPAAWSDDEELDRLTDGLTRADWRQSEMWCDRRGGDLWIHSDRASTRFIGTEVNETSLRMSLWFHGLNAAALTTASEMTLDGAPIFDLQDYAATVVHCPPFAPTL